MKEAQLSFVILSEIDKEKVYNIKGEKVEELPKLTFDIEENDYLKEEKNYLLRCATDTNYIFYYILNVHKNGISNLEWYCFTKDEYYYDDIEEDVVQIEVD